MRRDTMRDDETGAFPGTAGSNTILEEAQKQEAQVNAWLDPGSPQYRGPGWYRTTDEQGKPSAKLTDDPIQLGRQREWEAARAPQQPAETLAATQQGLDLLQAGTTPAARPKTPPPAYQPTAGTLTTRTPAVTGSGVMYNPGVDTTGITGESLSAAAGITPAPGSQAPTVNREKIDQLTGGLNTYQNAIWELSQDNTGLSAAEAQLKKATELANIQAGIATEASQRSALGMARGGRNRGDRALLERQAVGEAAFIGQDAARTAALTRAESEGKLAELRAGEEDADRRFRLDAMKEAANLGLNVSALELDISKVNLESATNWINNEFAREGLQLQLSQQQAEAAMGFTRDMAALQFQYDQMSVEDQNETDRLLMEKYRIDEATMVALKQIKASKEFDWNGVATALIGGAASGATAAIAKSDERAKTSIQEVDATAAELDELMGALGAYSYEYKEPEKDGVGLRFGFMAHELEKTKLGKHMVKPDREGFKTVEVAPLALATASGLALVHERLRELEKAVH